MAGYCCDQLGMGTKRFWMLWGEMACMDACSFDEYTGSHQCESGWGNSWLDAVD